MKPPLEVYYGSNGEDTKALYADLEKLGPAGMVAMNLFRACKCSERAKVYRGRRFKDEAYGRKNWSMGLLCDILTQHSAQLGIQWGWKEDPEQSFHKWVLYVEIPLGQVSFHSATRMKGPDYNGDWDQMKGVSGIRVCRWASQLLGLEQPVTLISCESSPVSEPIGHAVQAFLAL